MEELLQELLKDSVKEFLPVFTNECSKQRFYWTNYEEISEETAEGTFEGISWKTLEGITRGTDEEIPGENFDEVSSQVPEKFPKNKQL